MMIIITIIVFILILGLLIFAHEFGHFIVAKKSGVKVLEFAFGFPPRIFSWKRGETKYSLNAIPVGGYVKMLGEDEDSQSPDSFSKKKVINRLAIVFAGVLFNFLLAIILLTIGFSLGMTPIVTKAENYKNAQKTSNILIIQVDKDSAAQKAGITDGDIILGFQSEQDFQDFTKSHKNETVTFAVKKNKKVENIKVTLADSDAPLGVGLVGFIEVKLPFYRAFGAAIIEAVQIAWLIIKFLGLFFKNLFVSGKVSEEVTGPVGVFTYVSSAVKIGFVYVLQLTALISVNLALVNLIPFPALDGGRLLFLSLEGVRGKRVIKAEIENIIHLIGFILLILLIIAITYRDIIRFVIK